MSEEQSPNPTRRSFLGAASTAAMAGGLLAGYGIPCIAFALTAILVISADHHQAAELALGASRRLERDTGEAADLRQRPLEAIHQLERALHELDWLVPVGDRFSIFT